MSFGPTEHGTNLPIFTEQVPVGLDLDADGRADKAMLYQGKVYVYLGGRPIETDATGAPINADLTRLPDQLTAEGLPDTSHQGLLSQISKEDLQQTDLYIYRQSTGERIGELRGLKESDVRDGILDQDGGWYYRLQLATGFNANEFNGEGRRQVGWSSRAQVNDDRYKQAADHLRPGESLKLIAINRKTGYIGTVVTQIQAAQNGRIDFPVGKIVLRPPNLKISAERQYAVQAGITEGEDRTYLIGFEGSALTSDDYIFITTEWFDHDGTPLPADLPGYTGRLVQLVDVNQLEDNKIAHFAISPGRHLQMVALQGQGIQNKHYYLHVNGYPKTENPDFTTLGAGQGVLQYRPKYYVPFEVPIYNETRTQQQNLAYNQAVNKDLEAERPEPNYVWAYRPEMQFSVYDLTMKAINRPSPDDNTQVIDLLGGQNGTLSAQTDYLQLLFDLIAPSLPPLQAFGPAPELVFNIGGAETQVTFGQNGQVQFDDLSHLDKLTAEDYVTLQLYQNSDAGNILWEWQTAPIYLEKLDSEYPDVALAWDTYYPALGDKLITVRSELNAEELEGRQVRAEIVSAPGEPGEAGLLVNNKPEKTATATFFQRGGQYKAQFKLSGRNLAPDAASNNPIKVRFTLLSADGTRDEANIEQDWRVKNNSNTTLDEVLKGEGVFVYDSDTTAFKQEDHIGVSDGQVRKFDYVQGVPSQRTLAFGL